MAIAEQVREIATTIQTSLTTKDRGLDQRPNGRLFPSYRNDIVLPGDVRLGTNVSDLDIQHGQFGERATWTSTSEGDTRKRRATVLDSYHGTLTVVQDTYNSGEHVGTEVLVVSDDPQAEGRYPYPAPRNGTLRRHATDEEARNILVELNAIVTRLRQPRNAAPVA